MLDIKYVRENIEDVAKALANRNAEFDTKKFLALEEDRRKFIAGEEELQASRNSASKKIGELMSKGEKDAANKAKDDVRKINDKLEKAKEKREEADAKLRDFMLAVPNIPHESTPVGKDENDNPEVRKWGEPREFDFEAKAHWDIGTDLGVIDFERGVKLAKSRFYVLAGAGAKLERALINYMADTHTAKGYKEW